MLQRVLNSAGIDVRSCAELLGFNPDLFVQWAANPNQIPQSIVPLLSAVLSVPQSLFSASPKAAKNLKDSGTDASNLVQVSRRRFAGI